MIHKIEVENIKCGGCMNSIKTALLKIENANEVSIDKETDTIIIHSDTDRSVFIKTLSSLGYPEKGNNTLLHKGKSLVSCAVGNLTK
ncbi:heavy-metal-associated domain-containing protein [Flavobacterium sp. NST-5]|uniref:Heavy-metal-associated domain-containing protein n=1 Tax=Flavobacterium ichthyis TaxID=2698827 RepID=A0ABW9Z8F6_9FLAO|nr:cation transporter [Flavobacterium ichthyis]NBL65153.1 heavy-metal-associated domain-containing protein [Flavobacterium ichthyis]